MRQANNVTPLIFFFVEYESEQQLDVMLCILLTESTWHAMYTEDKSVVASQSHDCCEMVTEYLAQTLHN
jgi:hypothetical protein